MPFGPFRSSGRHPGILPALAFLLFAAVPARAPAQPASSIGIYNDLARNSCSLSDQAGSYHLYVIANTQYGSTGVRFAAPKPDCFNASWISDEVPPGYFSIGQSQDDISIAFGGCVQGPTLVLTINYQKTADTAPCCEYPIVKAALEANVMFTDCQFTEYPMPGASGWVNGNETCPCGGDLDLPPSAAFNPSPQNGITNQALSLSLYWEATDPEGQPLHYDVYFGTETDPPLVASGLTTNGYDVSGLTQQTMYYWKIVTKDTANQATDGLVWYFTTGTPGQPPPAPVNPTPADGALNVGRAPIMSWEDAPGGGDLVGYDFYFGTAQPLPKYATRFPGQRSVMASNLALDTTYYWQVIAVGQLGSTTPGPIWSFHTTATNSPPNAPTNPTPANGAQNISANPTLMWDASEPDGGTLKYDLYFGTVADPPFLQQTTTKYWGVVASAPLTDYFWRVVAIDSDGASTSGPVWTFKTKDNLAPTVPALVSPPDGGQVSHISARLRWTASDPEGGQLTYEVFFGTSNPPPSYTTTTSQNYGLPILVPATTYYWKIIAKETGGLTTPGPVWSFSTYDLQAPSIPASPVPGDGSINVTRMTNLSWFCVDQDTPQLVYDVYFDTVNPPSQMGTVNYAGYSPQGSLPFGALEFGTTYFWKVVARDNQGHVTAGPLWSFTTSASNQPPIAPYNPVPAPDADGQLLDTWISWASIDPESLPLRYDVYFGQGPTPPKVSTNQTIPTHHVTGLVPSTDYYWKIVVRDVDGNETEGAVWRFRTSHNPMSAITMGLYSDEQGSVCRLANPGPGLRQAYVVIDGPATYTGCRFRAEIPNCFNATWISDETPYVTIGSSTEDMSIAFGQCLDPPIVAMTITYMSNGATSGCCNFPLTATVFTDLLVTDCLFAELEAQSFPVLGISGDNSCPPCDGAGYLRFSEAADTCSVGSSRQITVDVQLSPIDSVNSGGFSVTFSPSLAFVACERGDLTQGWTTFDHNVVGNTINISAAADPGYDPQSVGVFARLTFETNCCEWTDPVDLHLSGVTGDFVGLTLTDRTLQCRYRQDGDVNNDGAITVADAQCALNAYIYNPLPIPGGCGGPNYTVRADVDCSGAPTPGDAYCIFHYYLDQSCSFCGLGGGPTLAAGVGGIAPPLALRAVREGDEIVVVLRASGAGTIDALGLELEYPKGLDLIRVESPRSDAFAALQTRVVAPGRLRIGAYADGDGPSANGDVIAVRFRATDATVHGTVTAGKFVDALAGAPDIAASLDGSAVTPPAHEIVLYQNTPNPFNPRTSIRFELPDAERVRLRVFDVHGRLVKLLLDERRDAGVSSVDWDGRDENGNGVATGVYFYVLDAGAKRIQHKMVLLK